MKSAWRLILALMIAITLAACQTTPDEPEPTPDPEPPKTDVDTSAAPDPRDYTDSRNFDNPESLLSKRVIYFDFDKSNVRPEYRGIVSAHAAYTAANSSARVTLEGHADERGTREYNLALGERRAQSVADVFMALGVSAANIENVSYGEENPVADSHDDSAWRLNRRVEIRYDR